MLRGGKRPNKFHNNTSQSCRKVRPKRQSHHLLGALTQTALRPKRKINVRAQMVHADKQKETLPSLFYTLAPLGEKRQPCPTRIVPSFHQVLPYSSSTSINGFQLQTDCKSDEVMLVLSLRYRDSIPCDASLHVTVLPSSQSFSRAIPEFGQRQSAACRKNLLRDQEGHLLWLICSVQIDMATAHSRHTLPIKTVLCIQWIYNREHLAPGS